MNLARLNRTEKTNLTTEATKNTKFSSLACHSEPARRRISVGLWWVFFGSFDAMKTRSFGRPQDDTEKYDLTTERTKATKNLYLLYFIFSNFVLFATFVVSKSC
jgi:hypothetical protein